jgi:hypothetical protein
VLAPLLTGWLALSTSSAATSPPVFIAAPNALGFEDAELPALQQRLNGAVEQVGVVVIGVDAVAPECAADPACIAPRVTGGRALLVVDVSKVGSDVDVTDTVHGPDGAVLATAHRTLGAADFDAAPLSPEVTAALQALRPPPTEAAPSASTAAPAISPSLIAVGVGAAVGVAGLAGFVVEAATLEDPNSLGGDKERARLTSWVFLGVAAAGVGGAVASGLLWPEEPPPSGG